MGTIYLILINALNSAKVSCQLYLGLGLMQILEAFINQILHQDGRHMAADGGLHEQLMK